jgi:serine/threonine protein kinase
MSFSHVSAGLTIGPSTMVSLNPRTAPNLLVSRKRKREEQEEKVLDKTQGYIRQFFKDPTKILGPKVKRACCERAGQKIFEQKTIYSTDHGISVLSLFLPNSRTEAISHVAIKTSFNPEANFKKSGKRARLEKKVERKALSDAYEAICLESSMLQKAQGSNIQPLITTVTLAKREPKVALVYPWLENILSPSLHETKPLPLPTTLRVIKDVLEALKGLKEKGLVHGDLKPQNILWDPVKEKWTLIDFGTTFFEKDKKKLEQIFTTIRYCPWEGLCKRADLFSFSYDIWSLGCMVYELCTGYCLSPEHHLVPIQDSNGVRKEVINEILQQYNLVIRDPLSEGFLPEGNLRRELFEERDGEIFFKNPARHVVLKKIPEEMLACLIQAYGDHAVIRKLSKELSSFVLRALKINPVERITIEEALQLGFLQENIFENPIVQKEPEEICFFRLFVEKRVGFDIANIHRVFFFKESTTEENLIKTVGIENEGQEFFAIVMPKEPKYKIVIETICSGERRWVFQEIKNYSGMTIALSVDPENLKCIRENFFDPIRGVV